MERFIITSSKDSSLNNTNVDMQRLLKLYRTGLIDYDSLISVYVYDDISLDSLISDKLSNENERFKEPHKRTLTREELQLLLESLSTIENEKEQLQETHIKEKQELQKKLEQSIQPSNRTISSDHSTSGTPSLYQPTFEIDLYNVRKYTMYSFERKLISVIDIVLYSIFVLVLLLILIFTLNGDIHEYASWKSRILGFIVLVFSALILFSVYKLFTTVAKAVLDKNDIEKYKSGDQKRHLKNKTTNFNFRL